MALIGVGIHSLGGHAFQIEMVLKVGATCAVVILTPMFLFGAFD